MLICNDARCLPRAQEWTGVDICESMASQCDRRHVSLMPTFSTQSHAWQAAIVNVFRIMHKTVSDKVNRNRRSHEPTSFSDSFVNNCILLACSYHTLPYSKSEPTEINR